MTEQQMKDRLCNDYRQSAYFKIKKEVSRLIQEDDESMATTEKKTDFNDEAYKVGYSVDTRKYWYSIQFITQKKNFEYNDVKRVYLDADNKTVFVTNSDDANFIITYSPNDMFVVKKYEQIDKRIITGFEKATVEQLSQPDYTPVPIWETVEGTPTVIPINLAVNDRDGYSIVRNTR